MLYKQFDVWKWVTPRKAVRYRCFQLLADNRFCVQNADIFEKPFTLEQERNAEREFISQFIDQPPNKRRKTFKTVEEAIFEFDIESELFWED